MPTSTWKLQFKNRVEESDRVFVFWCDHSAASKAVGEEIEYAKQLNRIVVPVLLDNTPLSESLSYIHGIDLRATRVHRLDPLRTLAPRLVTGGRLLVAATLGEGRRVDSILFSFVCLVLAALWIWLFLDVFEAGLSVLGAALKARRAVIAVIPVIVLAIWAAKSQVVARVRLLYLHRFGRQDSPGAFVVREFTRHVRGTQVAPTHTPPPAR
jgi:hypothetical protein